MSAVDAQALISPMDQGAKRSHHKRTPSPFCAPGVAQAVDCDVSDFSPFEYADLLDIAGPGAHVAPVQTNSCTTGSSAAATPPTAAAAAAAVPHRQQQQQKKQQKRVTFFSKLFSCGCLRPRAAGDEDGDGADTVPGVRQRDQHGRRGDLSPCRSVGLAKQASVAYTDADWFDARSEFSSALGGQGSDQQAKLEELAAMLRDGAHLNTHPSASLALAPPAAGPHIPSPPLHFAEPGLQFVPVPAATGFAAYWEKDPERSTAHPSPIDQLTNISLLAQKSHASIPGIWLQETAGQLTMIVKPRFMPPGLPRYTEYYDKANAPSSWAMRRDLRLGTSRGEIFFTACGMLVLRAISRPLWGSTEEFCYEEYMRLEAGGSIIVVRMCCLDLKTGKTATQYVVGKRHEVPLRGHV